MSTISTMGTSWTLRMVAVAILAALSFGVAAQSKFIWTDESGRKVYSDTPPPASMPKARILKGADLIGKPATATASSASTPTSAAVDTPAKAPPTLAEREMEAKKRDAEGAEKAKEAQAKATADRATAERCTALRAQLANLESGQRLSRTNEKGERELVDDTTRAAEADRARAAMAQDCR